MYLSKRIYFPLRLFYLQLVSIIIFRVDFFFLFTVVWHSKNIELEQAHRVIANKSRFKLFSSSLSHFVYRNFFSIHHSPTSFTARCSPDNKFYSSLLSFHLYIFFDTFFPAPVGLLFYFFRSFFYYFLFLFVFVLWNKNILQIHTQNIYFFLIRTDKNQIGGKKAQKSTENTFQHGLC